MKKKAMVNRSIHQSYEKSISQDFHPFHSQGNDRNEVSKLGESVVFLFVS